MKGRSPAPMLVAMVALAACGRAPVTESPRAPALRADFGAEGAVVSPGGGAGWAFRAAPWGFGCDGVLAPVGEATRVTRGLRTTYARAELDEWYAPGPGGVEQGFTLPAPPACRREGGRGVVIALGDGLSAEVEPGGQEARLRDGSGREVLRYADLHVIDAAGRALPATMEARGRGLSIRFDDDGAAYPVVVDPVVWAPVATLTASKDAPGDTPFGEAVALSGDTIVVGAPGANFGYGGAFVFVRWGTGWTLHQDLAPSSDSGLARLFGAAVAMSGDTLLVGAPVCECSPTTPPEPPTGAAFVFGRTGGTWALTQEIDPPSTAPFPFGTAVALSGDTAVIGSGNEADVYVLTGTTWTLQQTLNEAGQVQFGLAVALDGDTAVIGSPGPPKGPPGHAYVYVRTGTTWSQQASLGTGESGDRYGTAVAIRGDTAIVSAPLSAHGSATGALFVYTRTGTTWAQTQAIDAGPGMAQLGLMAAFDGTTVALTSGTPEGPQVFALDGGTFAAQEVLASSVVSDSVPSGVAVEGTTLVSGDPLSKRVFVFGLVSADGDACTSASECASGFCVDGVCCGTASCPPAGACNAAEHCQPGTGVCSGTPIHEGMACDDHDLCTPSATCQNGACTGPTKLCPPPDECSEFGTCDPSSGACNNPPKPDGTPCSKGTCAGGVCGTPAPPPAAAGCSCGAAGGTAAGGAALWGLGAALLARRRGLRRWNRARGAGRG